jgi:dTMP kinase
VFITFEGPDGSGKSTQIKRLAARLQAEGRTVLLTREPGGTAIGEQIREVLHDLKNKTMQPRAEVMLFSAARAQLVGEVIRPHLQHGGVVLSDRFYDSTFAYQGYGHGLDLAELRAVTQVATGGLTPDLTLLFDLDPAEGLQRRLQNNAEWTRLDDYALAFHQRVRAGYLELAHAEPQRWVILNAALSPADLFGQVSAIVTKRWRA